LTTAKYALLFELFALGPPVILTTRSGFVGSWIGLRGPAAARASQRVGRADRGRHRDSQADCQTCSLLHVTPSSSGPKMNDQ
jgi:hypothetical protein